MTTFKQLGLNHKIMEGLVDLGFIEPCPIQEKAIPFILESKKDLIALAQTGTGKTAAFGLPILNQIKSNEKDLQAIILCPTRELCIQISRDMKGFAKYLKEINITAVYGGERIDLQIKALKNGTNIVVGTPGRVHDLIRRKVLRLQSIKWLVLDEADEMLDMGFKDDLDAILEQTPKTRRTLLFSATISKKVYSIAKNYMTETQEISIGEKNIGAENVAHEYFVVRSSDRFEALKRILDSLPGIYGILFCRTRDETQKISDKLKQAHYDTECLHGDIPQNMRTKIMDRFKKKQIRLLVATDVAARGIDVSNLSHIINYNLPDQDEAYTHRSGRTGRAQKSGISICILSPGEVRRIKNLENMIGKKFEYKKVPSGEDVYEKQIDSFIKEIEDVDFKKDDLGKYFSEITDKLKKINKEDLINYLIFHKFHSMNDYENAGDLNAGDGTFNSRTGDSDYVSLKMNLGRKNGFDVKSLFTLINTNKNLKGIEIGKINLRPEYLIFSVEKSWVDEVIENLKGINFRGRRIEISKSSERTNYSNYRGGRTGQSDKGFNKKRRRRSYR